MQRGRAVLLTQQKDPLSKPSLAQLQPWRCPKCNSGREENYSLEITLSNCISAKQLLSTQHLGRIIYELHCLMSKGSKLAWTSHGRKCKEGKYVPFSQRKVKSNLLLYKWMLPFVQLSKLCAKRPLWSQTALEEDWNSFIHFNESHNYPYVSVYNVLKVKKKKRKNIIHPY